jgi:hypothetical protein
MTTELETRIAKLIARASSPEEAARMAIAVMRKPTKAMLYKGQEALGRAWKKTEECWVAMIDEALR